ncbi:hypothetical protein MIZ03_4526 [Rhodoferax lithotrophicus]|uniref:Uncharacterized protein n=1 Tax=Rhodoferax lithotrophicus TaxID=2798804 RepID=A0ABN6DHC1_9BURK|nr:hypothetical protein MIZ03_4526 [Rhodoferax sp. MIZ03]
MYFYFSFEVIELTMVDRQRLSTIVSSVPNVINQIKSLAGSYITWRCTGHPII